MDILSYVIGFLGGIVVVLIFNLFRYAGHLRIDTSDPMKDYYLIDISKDLNVLSKRKSIILKIDSKYKKPQ